MNVSVEAIRRSSSPLAREVTKVSDFPIKSTFRSQRLEGSLEADTFRPESPPSGTLGKGSTSHRRSLDLRGGRPTSIAREITFNKSDDVETRIKAAAALGKADKTRKFVLLWGFCFILTLGELR